MTDPHQRAVATLLAAGVTAQVVYHRDLPQPITSPVDYAAAVGIDLGQVTKTLFVADPAVPTDPDRTETAEELQARFALVTAAMTARLDWTAVGQALGWKRATMGNPDDLLQVTGFERHGVGPVGSRIPLRVVIESAVLDHQVVSIGGGEPGIELLVEPQALAAGVAATILTCAID